MNTYFGIFKKKWVAGITIFLVLCFLFYIGFVNCTEPTEIGIARNHISGKMWAQKNGGIHLTPLWVGVARVDIRPVRVAVTSAGRGYSAKLIQFNPEYWREFVDVEGWRYYWWANRFSFNFGYEEEYRGMRDLMRGYAYSAKQYLFLNILKEYKEK
ncbi:MAG: hypothetical protein UT90_C0004G0050 [Parcubacteria group bacterium GW2011_GWA1_40_21]|nr:MAG: hypothetical protein UT80_C0022G0005 [Parcubacteria group bacterium GW2011_GWC1_40_13]KKR53865.1 MAG: hypothetical protein UT90_C0004G0050 [Parcubacteria group bacterium GW2011_GWA1_40_21]